MNEIIYTNNFEDIYLKALNKIEEYCQYCLRCLHRVNIHPTPTEFAFLTFKRENGTIAEALIFPISAIKNDNVSNPMFCYGFKADFDFRNLEKPIKVTFSENFEELKK